MNDLGTALRELADRPHVAAGGDPADLWRRGRRRVRRRRAIGAGVVALVLVGVGLGSVLVPDPVVVMPTGPVHGPAYPEHLYRPSKWLAGTDDRGPLGQLALVSAAEQGSRTGVVGISATTGEYRFLDLPGWVRGSQVALAPDGRHVAYWTTGHTTGTPYSDGRLAEAGRPQAIGGVGLYDTATGAVQRSALSTEHGMTDDPLLWIDSATVYFGDWQLSNPDGATRTQFLSVAVGRPAPVVVPSDQGIVIDGFRNADGTFLTSPGTGRRRFTMRPAPSAGVAPDVLLVRDPTPIRLPDTLADGVRPTYGYASLAADGRVVVVDTDAGFLMAGDVSGGGAVTDLTVLDESFKVVRVLGWHDGNTLLAYGQGPVGATLAAVDVDTGNVTTLSRSEPGWGETLDPAVDVLRADLVNGRRPPSAADPRRRVTGIALGALALAGGVVWLVRRRLRA